MRSLPFILLLCGGCSAGRPPMAAAPVMASADMAAPLAPGGGGSADESAKRDLLGSAPAFMTPAAAGPGTQQPTPASTEPARAPILIYNAQITMAVFDAEVELRAVEELGRELGGFLARRTDLSVTIRVPALRFQEALRRISLLGDVTHRDISAEDVTQEFMDLEVRLKNARAGRERLEQVLKRANDVKDALLVERELDRLAAEIERIEGRLKYLRDRAAFSTLTVSFQPRPREQIEKGHFPLPFPWLQQLGIGRLLRVQ
jgi:hypothetical protein